MEIIPAVYGNGRIMLSRKIRRKKEMAASVVFENSSRKTVGLNGKDMKKLCGIVQLGGNALLDSESLYS
jgi:hypothetical protein